MRVFLTTFFLGSVAAGAGAAHGQDYPAKPIRIVTAPAGGGGDMLSRQIAQGVSGNLGQPVVIDNRPNGVAGPNIVTKSLPDGYTLLVIGSTFWLEPLLQKIPYDPVTEFTPVTTAVSSLSVLVAHPSLPVKSVRDLIALARARPGALNYASTGVGGIAHLSMELFKSLAKVNIVGVPYSGGNPAIIAMLRGEVQLIFSTAVSAIPHVQSGKLKALAVASPKPSLVMPGVPTVAATGLPGYEYVAVLGMFAPARVPEAIIRRLNQEVVRFLTIAGTKQRLLDLGYESIASSPEELAARMKSDIVTLGKVIKDAGIKAD